jgi:hypothetical protein
VVKRALYKKGKGKSLNLFYYISLEMKRLDVNLQATMEAQDVQAKTK